MTNNSGMTGASEHCCACGKPEGLSGSRPDAEAAELPQPWPARQDADRVLFNNGFSGLFLQVSDKKELL
jgi:hypothetical protein